MTVSPIVQFWFQSIMLNLHLFISCIISMICLVICFLRFPTKRTLYLRLFISCIFSMLYWVLFLPRSIYRVILPAKNLPLYSYCHVLKLLIHLLSDNNFRPPPLSRRSRLCPSPYYHPYNTPRRPQLHLPLAGNVISPARHLTNYLVNTS
jgi:hypothetical protein